MKTLILTFALIGLIGCAQELKSVATPAKTLEVTETLKPDQTIAVKSGDLKGPVETQYLSYPLIESENPDLEVMVKPAMVHDVQRNYPMNETARKFAQLVKQKTLTEQDLKLIESLGYIVTEVQE